MLMLPAFLGPFDEHSKNLSGCSTPQRLPGNPDVDDLVEANAIATLIPLGDLDPLLSGIVKLACEVS
jgi:hypothetical protein